MTNSGGKTADIARHKPQWHREYGQLQDKAGYGRGEIFFFFNRNNSRMGIKLRHCAIHESIENGSLC